MVWILDKAFCEGLAVSLSAREPGSLLQMSLTSNNNEGKKRKVSEKHK